MAQTDRQTDKATWWSLTIFDEAEKAFAAAGVFPPFVAQLHGGLEKCPDTGRIHFQGALQCRSQQRFTAIKKIFPKAHIEAARSAEALRKYAMKQDTAHGAKSVVANATPYWTTEMILKLLAITSVPISERAGDRKERFWSKVRVILYQKPYLVGLLAKPDIMRIYENTESVWIDLMTDPETNELLDEGAIVLQPPASLEVPDVISLEINSFTPSINGPISHQDGASSETSSSEESQDAKDTA